MPELPEVETTRRGLMPAMEGKAIARVVLNRPDLRFPIQSDFRSRIGGQTVEKIDRRAKYLLLRLSSGDVLVAHLGMSGSFRVESNGAAQAPAALYREIPRLAAHDHVVFEMGDGGRVIYNDPRRFGFMFVANGENLEAHPRMRGIGIEPLAPPIQPAILARLFEGASTSLKAALLDQKRIAGLGNIYVCEALFRSQLSPRRSAATLATRKNEPTDRAKRLVSAIHGVLNQAIKAGGSSLRDHRQTSGELGYFQHSFQVYDREGEPCQTAKCSGIVKRFTQNGRSTFWCPKCQK